MANVSLAYDHCHCAAMAKIKDAHGGASNLPPAAQRMAAQQVMTGSRCPVSISTSTANALRDPRLISACSHLLDYQRCLDVKRLSCLPILLAISISAISPPGAADFCCRTHCARFFHAGVVSDGISTLVDASAPNAAPEAGTLHTACRSVPHTHSITQPIALLSRSRT